MAIAKKNSDEPLDLVPDTESISPGSRLLAPQTLVNLLAEVKEYVQGVTYIDGIEVPRYGLLSLKTRGVPMFVYGRDFKPFQDPKYGKKTFAVGNHVFVHADWLWSLMRREEISNGAEVAVVPQILRMVYGIQKNHERRLTQFEREIGDEAKDIHAWTNLRLAFGTSSERRNGLNFAQILKENFSGFGDDDLEKYPRLSEETIAKMLRSEKREKKQEQQNQQSQNGQQGQKSQNGQGGQQNPQPQQGPGQQQPQNGQGQGGQQPQNQQGQGGQQPQNGQSGQQPQNGQGQGGQQPQGGQQSQNGQGQGGNQQDQNGQGQQPGGQQPQGGQGDQSDDYDGVRSVPMNEFIKDMEKGGYQDILDKLHLPASDDLESLGKIEEKTKMKDLENLQMAASQMSQLGGKYPGGHIVEAESERVKTDAEGKLEWNLGIREMILGDGRVWKNSWDEMSDLYFMDPEDMGRDADDPLCLPSSLPHKPEGCVVVIIDTSGSVHQEMLKMFMAEVFGLKKSSGGASDMAKEVVVVSADTVVRGEPVEITDDNYEELVDGGVGVFGRGGTDFATSLRMVAAADFMKEKKILGVVYMTDLCAARPNKADFPLDIPVAFVTCPSDYDIEFANYVRDWARVYPISNGVKVNLSEDFRDEAIAGAGRGSRP